MSGSVILLLTKAPFKDVKFHRQTREQSSSVPVLHASCQILWQVKAQFKMSCESTLRLFCNARPNTACTPQKSLRAFRKKVRVEWDFHQEMQGDFALKRATVWWGCPKPIWITGGKIRIWYRHNRGFHSHSGNWLHWLFQLTANRLSENSYYGYKLLRACTYTVVFRGTLDFKGLTFQLNLSLFFLRKKVRHRKMWKEWGEWLQDDRNADSVLSLRKKHMKLVPWVKWLQKMLFKRSWGAEICC